MATQRSSSREKILAAAADLAREAGPGRLSLEAVADRAGVSKGGLLYNFPTKAKLMQGLVEQHIAEFEAKLEAATALDGGGEPLLAAYLRLAIEDCDERHPPAAWIFSAMAEDPDFIRPIDMFRRKLLDRLRGEDEDPTDMLIAFLAVEGLRSMKLFGSDILTGHDHRRIRNRLLARKRRRRGQPEPAGPPGK